MTNDLYISMDENDFDCLVRGGELIVKFVRHDTNIHLILKDIGFDRMDEAIHKADKKIDIYKSLEKVIS